VLFAALAVYGLTRYRRGTPWLAVLLAGVAAGMAGGAWFASEGLVRLAFVTAALAASLGAVMIRRGPPALHKNGITLALLATRLVPPVVIVLPIYLMARYAGLLDTRSALVFVYTATNLPVAVRLLQPVIGPAASDLEEAAELDGASRLRILFDIVIPAAAPGVVAAGALVFLLCWNEYLFAVYLAPDRAMIMPPFEAAQMSVREQQAGSDTEELTHLAAAIVLMTAPLVLCAGLGPRFLSRPLR
jgi:multiple sugar transport system permease protein